MTNKTVKDAVDIKLSEFLSELEPLMSKYNIALMAKPSGKNDASIGFQVNMVYGSSEDLNVWTTRCHASSGEFKTLILKGQQLKEQKMEKQKYKYVDAGIKTVGELVDRLMRLESIFNGDVELELGQYLGVVNSGYSSNYSLKELEEILPDLTTRQPLPWYEVEGVFPCLVKYKNNGKVYFIEKLDGDRVIMPNGGFIHIDYCTPLSPEEAAKYGVVCED